MTAWSVAIGVATIVIFFLSIFAAIVCVELYLLLSKGVLGSMWRTLALAVIVFALAEVVAFGEAVGLVSIQGLSQLLRALFVLLLSLGFWQQHKAFVKALNLKSDSSILRTTLLSLRQRLFKVGFTKLSDSASSSQNGQRRVAKHR